MGQPLDIQTGALSVETVRQITFDFMRETIEKQNGTIENQRKTIRTMEATIRTYRAILELAGVGFDPEEE